MRSLRFTELGVFSEIVYYVYFDFLSLPSLIGCHHVIFVLITSVAYSLCVEFVDCNFL